MPKILVIDDRSDNLISVKAVLKSYEPDYEVILARSGREGIDLAVSERPDSILLDIQMPGMDGYAVCRELRSKKITRQIPIIFLTAKKTSAEDRIKGLEIGGDAYLAKPIDSAELIANIHVMLRIKKAEDDSLRVYKTIVSSSSDMMALLDREFTYVVVNTSYAKAFGMTIEQLIGLTPADVFGEDIYETLIQPYLEKCLKGNLVSYEINYDFPAAGKQDMDVNYNPYYDDNHKVAGIVVNTRNITKRKQAEEELKQSKERYDLAMMASKDGLYDWNLSTNEIYYSPGWKRMLGYEDNELPNNFSIWEDLTKKEDIETSWQMQKEVINKQRDRFELEFKMKHKEGHWVDILSRAEAVFDNNGKAIRIIGTHLDITEQKQAENKIRLQLEELRNWYKAMLNREERVLQLKTEVNELLVQARKSIRYKSVEVNDTEDEK